MFSPLYLLLTISIFTKYVDCYAVDNSASMRNEVTSLTDDRRTAYFHSNNNNNVNEVGNHIRTSSPINVTAFDNGMEMPKPNDVAVDDSTFRPSSDLGGDALAEVETGEPF